MTDHRLQTAHDEGYCASQAPCYNVDLRLKDDAYFRFIAFRGPVKVQNKKRLYDAFLSDEVADNWHVYQETKKVAKNGVHIVEATPYNNVNEKLKTRDCERLLYRIAKTLHCQIEGVEMSFFSNDENGYLLTNRKRAIERFHDYFESISKVEFAHPPIPCIPPTHGPVQDIAVEETDTATEEDEARLSNGTRRLSDPPSAAEEQFFLRPRGALGTLRLFRPLAHEGYGRKDTRC